MTRTKDGGMQVTFFVQLVPEFYEGSRPMAYGPPTFGPYTYETHAAHECRNRHCVAPEHLSWKTPKGNGADKIRDGSQAGQKHPHAKMTDGQVREILTRLSEPDRLLAIEFGVSRGTINDIRNGKRWKHIPR